MRNAQNQFYDVGGRRLFLTSEECAAYLEAAQKADPPIRTLCELVHWTSCLVSEALAVTRRVAKTHHA